MLELIYNSGLLMTVTLKDGTTVRWEGHSTVTMDGHFTSLKYFENYYKCIIFFRAKPSRDGQNGFFTAML